jgi:GNAT superfamily N-acetyltransferase
MRPSLQTIDLTMRDNFNRIGWFFRHEADGMPVKPLLFDHDRWGQCDEAIIAQAGNDIVGVATLAVKGLDGSGWPTLDTLYVTKGWRREGIGYELFERGLRRLVELGAQKVFCDLHSSIMLRLMVKLPPNLRSLLVVRESFRQTGDLAEELP